MLDVRSVALVPVLGALLLGCSGEEALRPGPLPSVARASPSPAALGVPTSAQAATPQGAAAFARYYVELLNTANASGQVDQLRAVSHPDCNVCRQLADTAAAATREGKSFQGGAYTVVFAEATERSAGDAVVDVVYDQAASVTKDRSGRLIAQGEARQRQTLQIRALDEGQGWRAYGVRFVQGGAS